ncbi:hypothetical protein MJD09_00175 [bacterium]|nr:hypothetical protein [bacterium]
MQKPFIKRLLYIALMVMALLHTDTWFWRDPTLILSLPVGIFYHIIFCVAASLMMMALVKLAWPDHLEIQENNPPEEP